MINLQVFASSHSHVVILARLRFAIDPMLLLVIKLETNASDYTNVYPWSNTRHVPG